MINEQKMLEILADKWLAYCEQAKSSWYYQGKVDMCFELIDVIEGMKENEAAMGEDADTQNMDDKGLELH